MTTCSTIAEVCRTCMKDFTDKCQLVHLDSVESTFNPTTIRQKLEAFAPELDLTVEFSSVICTECAASIEFLHKFKKKCLETEEVIQNYLRQFSVAEDYDDNSSFLKISAVQSLSDKAPLQGLICESAVKSEFPDYNYKASDLHILELNQIPIQNENQQPHLEIVDFDSVIFNTGNDVELSEDISQQSTSTTSLVSTEVTENEHAESSDNNPFQHNYIIFETFNMIRNKRNILYKCNDCCYSVTHKSSIDAHMKNHLKAKSYLCEQCGFKSSLKTILIAHAQNHKKNQSSKCNECNFATAFVSRITIHKKVHKCDKFFSCIKCNFVTENAIGIKSHVRSHERNNSNDCKGCKLLILKENNLRLQEMDFDEDAIH